MSKSYLFYLVCWASLLKLSYFALSQTDGLFFVETFETDPFKPNAWIKSSNDKYSQQPLKWTESTHAIPGFENDKGLLLSEEMKYYGVSKKFCDNDSNCKTFDLKSNNHKELVFQYELKLDDVLTCGGAYIKLLRKQSDEKSIDLAKVNNDSPYTIMFGPDKCGGTSKLHFIVQYQNPISKVWEEKHFNETNIVLRDDHKVHLYTLVIHAESNDFEIFVDMKSSKKGNLLTHMIPPIVPPKEIDDPTDSKPSTWVDNPKIEDEDAVKPDDWDEDAEQYIEDVKAVKPTNWLDDAPVEIPDPDHSKPEDWDDEEDGIWEHPTVPNPACEAAGCGVWKRPQIKNPAYKGKWRRPLVDNPAYFGPWSPRKIPNPDYFVETNPARKLAGIEAVAVEVWTTNKGILFDNFVLTHSQADAFRFAEKTFSKKAQAEAIQEKNRQKEENKDSNAFNLDKLKAMVLEYIQYLVNKANSAIEMVKTYSTTQQYGVAGAVITIILSIVYAFIPSSKEIAVAAASSKRSGKSMKKEEVADVKKVD